MLHSLDDSEVYYANKKPMPTAKERREIKEWEAHTGQAWTNKNYNLSFDATAEAGEGNDKTKLWHQVFNHQQEAEAIDSKIQRLREVVKLRGFDQKNSMNFATPILFHI